MKNETDSKAIRIAKQANLYAASMSHGTAVKCACADAGEDTAEMRSVVSTLVTNFDINGKWETPQASTKPVADAGGF